MFNMNEPIEYVTKHSMNYLANIILHVRTQNEICGLLKCNIMYYNMNDYFCPI